MNLIKKYNKTPIEYFLYKSHKNIINKGHINKSFKKYINV